MKWWNHELLESSCYSELEMYKHCFFPINNTWACVKLSELRGVESRWARTAVWNIPKQIYYKPYWSIPIDGHLGAVWCVSALQAENGISHEKLNVAKPAKCFHQLGCYWWKHLFPLCDIVLYNGDRIKQCSLVTSSFPLCPFNEVKQGHVIYHSKRVQEWLQEKAVSTQIVSPGSSHKTNTVALIAIEQVPHNQWQVKSSI